MENVEIKCTESHVDLFNSDLNEIVESLKTTLCYKYKNGFETKETIRVLRKLESLWSEMLYNQDAILHKKYALFLDVNGY